MNSNQYCQRADLTREEQAELLNEIRDRIGFKYKKQ